MRRTWRAGITQKAYHSYQARMRGQLLQTDFQEIIDAKGWDALHDAVKIILTGTLL
jgi:hypothetical protein